MAKGTPSAVFPPEIVGAFLDYLHDDFQALGASSLVQRSWVPAARHHLVNPAVLRAVDTNLGRIGNVEGFLALIQSPHSTILPAIRSVVIHIHISASEGSAILEEVVEALSRTPTLKKLILMDDTCRPLGSWIAQKLSHIEEFVSSTVFSDCYGGSFSLLFPRLRSLALYTRDGADEAMQNMTSKEATVPGTFAYLRTLRLKLNNPVLLLEWLLGAANSEHGCMALETLDLFAYSQIHSGWDKFAPALNMFLKGQASSIKHLCVGIEYHGYVPHWTSELSTEQEREDQETTVVDLSGLSRLQTLAFRTHDVRAVCASLATLEAGAVKPQRLAIAIDCIHRDARQLLVLLGNLTTHGKPLADTFIELRLLKNTLASGTVSLIDGILGGHQTRGLMRLGECVQYLGWQVDSWGSRNITHVIPLPLWHSAF